MKDGVTVTNIMKDGTVCEDLSTYINAEHPLPKLVARLIYETILAGRAARERDGD